MPQSKRPKVVHLAKTKKKTRSAKENLVNQIREALESYSRVYVVEVENVKNIHVQSIRRLLKPGRMFYGKSRVMQVALGTTSPSESATNLHQIAKLLQGPRGLIFCNLEPAELQNLFDDIQPEEFAKSGFRANQTVVLKKLLGIRMAQFKMKIVAAWNKENSEVQLFIPT